MRVIWLSATVSMLLGGCAGQLAIGASRAPVEVKIIAFNDFHGNLEPPRLSVPVATGGTGVPGAPAGGVAYLASAINGLRAANPYHVVVSAGDLIGASPLVSAAFLDEPTVMAMNLIRLDFNAAGNHEFDRGRAELLRMQAGGCAKHTQRQPCRIDRFPGAKFAFLAANTVTERGTPLFAPTAIRSFGRGRDRVRVGFIGMTLKGTSSLVAPPAIAGLRFRDEADTANALVPRLRAAGADAIVLLIHQGVRTKVAYNDKSCDGLEGELLPVLSRLSPAIDVVVSGHTHRAYVCDHGRVDPARPFLLTSAGLGGTLLTDITIAIDPRTRKVTRKRADNVIVQSEPFDSATGRVAIDVRYARYQPDREVAALVARYAAAAAPLAARIVGRLSAPALRARTPSREQVLGNLIADAQLAATRAPAAGGARIAFMNPDGVRADIVPGADGAVTYGQLFTAQPFGNDLVVKSFTGRQIRALLEQQFEGAHSVTAPKVLLTSSTLRYGYDLSRPAGERIVDPRVEGAPLADGAVYRVTMNSFLASGGDDFPLFVDGTDPFVGPQDIDALEAYVAASDALTPPATDRLNDLTPK